MATTYTKESKPTTIYSKEYEDVLLTEDGFYFLLENGIDCILLESSWSLPSTSYTKESKPSTSYTKESKP